MDKTVANTSSKEQGVNIKYLRFVLLPMKVVHHQYFIILVVGLFLLASAQSLLFDNGVLHRLSVASMYMMTLSIVVGIVLAIYIHFTKNQLFDPLSSELDSDEDDP